MWIEHGDNYAKLVRATDAERAWLTEYLAFTDSAAKYRKGRTHSADGKVRMFNVFNQTFPSGFLSLVQRAAPEEGFSVELADNRCCPCPRDPDADLGWLRDYQLEGVERAASRGRGILWCPTGSGKTEIAVGLAQALPCRWLFLVHRASLMEQTAERYERRTGRQAGRIGDGTWNVPDGCTFVVATFQTLAKRLQQKDARTTALLAGSEGLIVDECHVLPAWSFWHVAMACPAYFRLGMSGTPLARGDQRSVFAIAALGPVIYRIKAETLIGAGVLARPHIHMVEVHHPRSDKPTWQGVYGENIVRSNRRNALVVEAVRRAERPCLVFVKEIRHGRELERRLWAAGLKPAFTWGSHSVEHRMRYVRDLVQGRIDVLVCSVVFQEGIDIPELRSVVVASGGKSVIAALQKLGRGMRPDAKSGKTDFECWDFHDVGCGCTKAKAEDGEERRTHSGCRWLERHSRARLRAYAQEGYETVIEQLVL
jgi:superfamily II DNA or RNA helicase